MPVLKRSQVEELYFYGTGCKNPANIKMVKKALKNFPRRILFIDNDLPGPQKRFVEMKKVLPVFWEPGQTPVIIMENEL